MLTGCLTATSHEAMQVTVTVTNRRIKKYSAYHIISDRGLPPQLTMETIILQVSIYQK